MGRLLDSGAGYNDSSVWHVSLASVVTERRVVAIACCPQLKPPRMLTKLERALKPEPNINIEPSNADAPAAWWQRRGTGIMRTVARMPPVWLEVMHMPPVGPKHPPVTG